MDDHTLTPRRGRRLALALTALAAVALTTLPTGAGAADKEERSSATVQSTPSDQVSCWDPVLALSRTVSDSAESFVLRIEVSAPLCSPVDAAAVIYDMPGDGAAWPQTLRERLDFRLEGPGVTEVVFDKGCGASQFDVVTGASPETIAPFGQHHGPLLFPFDIGTSLQHSGTTCNPGDEPSSVEVRSLPSSGPAPCLEPLLALSRTVSDSAESFVLRIEVSAPLCSPVDAAAVIYDMPGDGAAWPQTLRERVDFRLEGPGVTEVVFDKGCGASQFDVVTGASPETIAPFGQHHGPLLFPFDIGTSLQHSGPECTEVAPTTEPTTTTDPTTTEPTTTEGTTTTTTPASSTTVQDTSTSVVETTTTAAETTTTAADDDEAPDVLGATDSKGDSPKGNSPKGASEVGPEVLGASVEAEPAALALTGPTSTLAGLVGASLLTGGFALLLARRRPTS